MNPIVVLALTTPVWGFALQPTVLPSIGPQHALEVQSPFQQELSLEPDGDGQVEARNTTLMDLTRGFSVAGVIGLAVTTALGLAQYADEYGFHGDYRETACASGDAVLDDCGGSTPWQHLIAVGVTGAASLTALALSTQVDFDRAARHDGDWRTYEITRWVSHAMIAGQALLGFFTTYSARWGWLDPQSDFDTLHALTITHMALGAATLGLELYDTAIIF